MNKHFFTANILLPKTNFEMRGNLPVKEPNIEAFWANEDIYNKMLNSNNKDKAFYLHDGPPYANGNMHIGHALNKILKDIIVKYKTGDYLFSCHCQEHSTAILNKRLPVAIAQ